MQEKQKILIVDDTAINIKILNDLLKDDYKISIAMNGEDALKIASSQNKPDLILLDISMPQMNGFEVCRRLKLNEKTRKIPVLFVTTKGEVADETKGLELGAVDYIVKPFSPSIVVSRVKNHMELHLYRERLEDVISVRTGQLKEGYLDTIQRLVLASEYKDEETGAHIKRISYYTKELSYQLGMSNSFCDRIFYASPMHDIGKVAIPDTVLLKPGPFDDAEWAIMKSHTEVGAKILMGSDSPYLKMAVDIAASHHERWDGKGYPKGLKGEEIPLTARIMNISDQYDALRSKRPYKPSLSHERAVQIITEGDDRTIPEHFDPQILETFKKTHQKFDEIFETHSDR